MGFFFRLLLHEQDASPIQALPFLHIVRVKGQR